MDKCLDCKHNAPTNIHRLFMCKQCKFAFPEGTDDYHKLDSKFEQNIYKNEDKKCECWKCELKEECRFADRYQRLPRELAKGALSLCKKL